MGAKYRIVDGDSEYEVDYEELKHLHSVRTGKDWRGMFYVNLLELREVGIEVYMGEMNLLEVIHECQKNIFLKYFGYYAQEDIFADMDYDFSFYECKDFNDFIQQLRHGNWALRVALIYKNLCFVNQCNGGDEWFVVKKFDDEYVGFESISLQHILKKDGEKKIAEILDRLMKADKEKCLKCAW